MSNIKFKKCSNKKCTDPIKILDCFSKNKNASDGHSLWCKHSLWKKAKYRAKGKNINFDITVEDIIIPKKCPILNIDLIVADNKRTNNSPSLDRIDNNKGYTPDNIIVISWRANKLKSDSTLEELEKIVNFYKKL